MSTLDSVLGSEHHVCKQCGKRFEVHAFMDWGYKYGRFYACSYHCMRALRAADMAARRPVEKKPVPRGLKKLVSKDEKALMIRLRAEGMTMAAIARETGRPLATVDYHLKKEGKK